ncbi:hypothetical protein BHE74_00020874 [Ensete ventricosum]|nr:hypothetical protein BHE74_00020874 [Ensete ventricosum]
MRCRRPRPLFLPREEMESLPAQGIPPGTGTVPVTIICWYTGTERMPFRTCYVVQIVAGRFVNVFSTNDWILGITFRAR